MKRDEIIKLLEQVGAVRTGHFELTSGRHSGTYIQCALILEHPKHAEQLGRALADLFKDLSVACVVSPALGGILVGYEVARALGVRSLFVERDKSEQMAVAEASNCVLLKGFWSSRTFGRREARPVKRLALWNTKEGSWWRPGP